MILLLCTVILTFYWSFKFFLWYGNGLSQWEEHDTQYVHRL